MIYLNPLLSVTRSYVQSYMHFRSYISKLVFIVQLYESKGYKLYAVVLYIPQT